MISPTVEGQGCGSVPLVCVKSLDTDEVTTRLGVDHTNLLQGVSDVPTGVSDEAWFEPIRVRVSPVTVVDRIAIGTERVDHV